jgi:hypothetical protein
MIGVLFTGAILVSLGFPPTFTIPLAGAVAFLLGARLAAARTVVVNVVAALLLAAEAVWLKPTSWLAAALVLDAAAVAVMIMEFERLARPGHWRRGAQFSFVGPTTAMRLLVRRRWSIFTTAIDLATSHHADRATPFLDALDGEADYIEPLVRIARAHVALYAGRVGDAVADALAALRLDDGRHPPLTGWLEGQYARILQATGRPQDADDYRSAAISKLVGRRHHVHRRALWLAHVRYAALTAPVPYALKQVDALRRLAVRRNDPELLDDTEMLYIRLMIRASNIGGAAATIVAMIGDADTAKRSVHLAPEGVAEDQLIWAAALVELPGHEASARRFALAAASLLDLEGRPLAAAAARLVLSRIEEHDGHHQEALQQAVAAVHAVHAARYSLPSTSWRREWTQTQLSVYGRLLELVALQQDPQLMAEALELVRGEVLPAQVGTASPDLQGAQALLVLLGRQEGGPADGRAMPDYRHDLVLRPPPMRIGGLRRLPADHGDARDLERELLALAGQCWYWSGALVELRYHWAVRDPRGNWFAGSVDIGDGTEAARSIEELLRALPLRQTDETNDAMRERVASGALGRNGPPGAEVVLLSAVADSLLPPPLRAGLGDAGPISQVVVSLAAELSHIPVAGLPLDSSGLVRVVDRAVTIHVPAWAAVAHCRDLRPRSNGQLWPFDLAILDPDGSGGLPRLAAPIPEAATNRHGPLTKQQIAEELAGRSDDRHWLLFTAGHLVSDPASPARGGLATASADGTTAALSLQDLLEGAEAQRPRYPMPERAVVVGCTSIGLEANRAGEAAPRSPFSEWQGFGAAMLLAGARHVCCTLYPILDARQIREMSIELARQLVHTRDPAAALRLVQLAQLNAWRSAGSGHPFQWQAFAYVGLGSELG